MPALKPRPRRAKPAQTSATSGADPPATAAATIASRSLIKVGDKGANFIPSVTISSARRLPHSHPRRRVSLLQQGAHITISARPLHVSCHLPGTRRFDGDGSKGHEYADESRHPNRPCCRYSVSARKK